MKKTCFAALMILTLPAWAAPQTATLTVEGMTCAACPITVKKALNKLPGVSRTEIDFDKHQAIVTYDDAKTSADALMRATREAGYPSALAGNAK